MLAGCLLDRGLPLEDASGVGLQFSSLGAFGPASAAFLVVDADPVRPDGPGRGPGVCQIGGRTQEVNDAFLLVEASTHARLARLGGTGEASILVATTTLRGPLPIGLGIEDFLVQTVYVPAGGAGVEVVAVNPRGPGVYSLDIVPIRSSPWLEGKYTFRVGVSADGRRGQGLASLEIGAPELVPFIVEVPGGLADSAGDGTSNPLVRIDCSGAGEFVVTSVILSADAGTFGSFRTLSLNSVQLNSSLFEIATENIVGTPQTAGPNSADLLGMPRRNGIFGGMSPGGNVPHQIIARASGSPDIQFRLFASSSDTEDLNITSIRVSGWRRAGESVAVSYVPGD